MSKPTIFISYSHKDVAWKDRLVTHLGVLQVQDRLDFWTDDEIGIGAAWLEKIQDAMNAASVAILLVSADSLTSGFILREEIKRLLERREKDRLSLFPILVRPCAWKRVPWLAQMQMRPRDGIPLSAGSEHQIEEHLTKIVEEIDAALERVATSVPPPSAPPKRNSQTKKEPIVLPPLKQSVPPPKRIVLPLGVEPSPSSAPNVMAAKLEPTVHNSIGMEFILIPAGEFLMGADNKDAYGSERPVHKVRISRPFYLGKYPVTQKQWEAGMGNNPSRFKGDPTRPVENISWNDVQEFLQRLKEKDGKPYRLPTEAEWEYAARAGATTAYCFGDDPQKLPEYGWYDQNSEDTTHPVGKLTPNAWGLCDVHGNVWEWVQDWFDESYYQKSPTEDPKGPESGQSRVLRGGSWFYVAWDLRVSSRFWGDPGSRGVLIGFRCAW